MMEKYDISFLRDYLKLKGISIIDFSDYLDMTRAHTYRILNGEILLNAKHLNKLLKLFNVDSYEQLKNFIISETETMKINNSKYDILNLKDYLEENEIKINALADYLNISTSHIYKILDGTMNINPKYLNKIYELIDSNIQLQPKKSKKRYNVSFLKDYLQIINISQATLAKYLGVSRQFISTLLNGQKLANQNHLERILVFFNVGSYEELQELVNNEKNGKIKILKKTSK